MEDLLDGKISLQLGKLGEMGIEKGVSPMREYEYSKISADGCLR